MIGMDVNYLGKWVPKATFRTFIYGKDNAKKLVNSWLEYESHINRGEWFPTEEAALEFYSVSSEPEPVVEEPEKEKTIKKKNQSKSEE